MLKQKATDIINDRGEAVTAVCPVILSVSRSTDIPAFYADWFFDRLRKGYAAWWNPFSGKKSYISFHEVRLVVFWSKNPAPLLPYLHELDERGIGYYFQYTLNDYEQEGLEPNVPALDGRLDTFRRLSERVGMEKMLWRFDPLILTDRIGVADLLQKAGKIGDALLGYTQKLVFSFADIGIYRSVKGNLGKAGVAYREFSQADMLVWADGISRLNRKWGYELATCAEKIGLSDFGIVHNKCIDDNLIARLFPSDRKLMEYIGAEVQPAGLFGEELSPATRPHALRDTGQRALCECIPAKSLGEYNTCPHLCVYCYANARPAQVASRYRTYLADPGNELLAGD